MTPPRGTGRQLFDVWSLFYDAPWVQRMTYRPVHDAALRVLRRSEPRRVLDVGCGTGRFATRLGRELEGVQVVGCDFSAGMLRRARARARDGRWVRGNALALPFGPNCFDAVVATEAFHWFPDQAQALSEFHRVLVPDGRLLLALINPPLEVMSRAAGLGSHLMGTPIRLPTRAGMRRLLRDAGFRVEEQNHVLRLPAPFVLPTVLSVARR